ncbi:MAG: flavodoxin domain-containing protein [Clostridiales Family XIII bacterium]|nr:flavodoxin domain-containing protein [Clostridiales Family XIII bacterium]
MKEALKEAKIGVIYKSRYGTARQYAAWIAEELGADLLERSAVDASRLASYDLVVYGGGIYGGKINGVDLVANHECGRLVIFTVGLADPASAEYFYEVVDTNLQERVHKNAAVFHLRGGIDYKRLGFAHRATMAVLRRMALKRSPEERSEVERLVLETYGSKSKIDFVRRDAIEPLVGHVKGVVAGLGV